MPIRLDRLIGRIKLMNHVFHEVLLLLWFTAVNKKRTPKATQGFYQVQ